MCCGALWCVVVRCCDVCGVAVRVVVSCGLLQPLLQPYTAFYSLLQHELTRFLFSPVLDLGGKGAVYLGVGTPNITRWLEFGLNSSNTFAATNPLGT